MAEPNQETAIQEPHQPPTEPEKPAAPTHRSTPSGDPDAQAMVITSLRSQIDDLFSQVTQLNGKLVQSYDRVSDLEDSLHESSTNDRQSSAKISQLELERTQHLAALNTGLLVEKSHVTAELTRLMEKATEEAAQRGQAETAKADIEKDLDDLSATLFQEANTMVAQARFARAQSERKVEDAELALKGAEEAVAMMQRQMQEMQAEQEKSQQSAHDALATMGKGKWVERTNGIPSPVVRLISTHTPYQDFLLFVGHLRNTRATSPIMPPMPSLLSLPFLARLVAEDSEPTVRLDLAPSLNWLSRRSVLSAIHAGQLTIEPMSITTLLQESLSQASSGSSLNVSCALCGTHIFPAEGSSHSHSRPSIAGVRSLSQLSQISTSAWFKKPLPYSATNSAANSPPSSPRRSNMSDSSGSQKQIYIFRLAPIAPSATTNLSTSMLPITMAGSYSGPSSSTPPQHHSPNLQQVNRAAPSTIYPLCPSGWCLTRLRSTCTLWAFVRTGIIDKVWDEEPLPQPSLPPAVPSKAAVGADGKPEEQSTGKPPIPPRKRGLWSMASALGERAASWTDSDKGRAGAPEKEVEKVERRVPPPLPPLTNGAAGAVAKAGALPPPPLPKRATGRTRSATVSRSGSPGPIHAQTAPSVVEEEKEPAVNGDGDVHGEQASDDHHSEHATAEEISSMHPGETLFHAGDAHEHDDDTPTGTTDIASSGAESDSVCVSPPETPLERRKSHDSFASAASEIIASTPASPSPIRRAVPPAPIPIPATVTVATPVSPTPMSARPATPTRAARSSMDSAPATPTRSDAPVSAGSSPAPPPLPRRAAARVRPSSLVPSAPAPAPTPAPNPDVNAETAKDSGTVEEKAGEKTPVPPSADNAPDVPAPSEPLPTLETAGGSEPESEKPTDASAPSADALAAETSAPVDDVPSSPTPTILPTPHPQSAEAAPDTSLASKDAGSEIASEGFIGENTWEEKTWRELVRLKEDMFWARVGGLR